MNRKIKIASVMCASLLLVTGCGEVPKLKNGEEAVVKFEGIDGISAERLYKDLKANYGINSLLTLIDKQVYEKEFDNKVKEAKKYADDYIAQAVASYGNEETVLAQTNGAFSTIEAYNNYLYVTYLQNHAITKYSESLITDKQIEKYYNEESKADIELSHILITSDVSSNAKDEEIKKAEEKALEKAKSIIEKLKKADDKAETFKILAKEFSDDSATKNKGGSLGRVNYEELGIEYDELIKSAQNLKDGEYSKTVIKTELGYHVILKTKTYKKDSLKDLKDEIVEKLGKNSMQADQNIILDGMKHYREKYDINIVDDELNKEYKAYMKKLQDQINANMNQQKN